MATLITVPHFAPIYNVHVCLDGNENYIVCPQVNTFPSKEFTVECWINSSAAKPETLLNYSAPAQPDFAQLTIQNVTNLEFSINMMTSGPTGINIADGKWHLLSVCWTAYNGNMNIYVDGALVTTNPIVIAPGAALFPGGILLLGQSGISSALTAPSDALSADLANFRIWSRARSQYFINLDRSRTLTGSDVGTIWQNLRQRVVVNNAVQDIIFSCAAIASENSVLILDSNHRIWYTTDFGATALTQQPSTSVNMAYIAGSGTSTASIYVGIDVNQGIWLSSDNGTTWTNRPGGLVQAAVWPDMVVGVNAAHTYFYYPNPGSDWTSGDSTQLIWTAVNQSSAWGINTSNQLLISPSRHGNDWTPVAGAPPLLKISASSTMLQGIGLDGTMYASSIDGLSWRPISSPTMQPFFNGSMYLDVCWAVDTAGRLMFGELDTQMVVHWQFDEGYGTVAYDGSDHGNHGLLGTDLPETIPTWEVASMLMPPGFIFDTFIPLANLDPNRIVNLDGGFGFDSSTLTEKSRLASAGGDIPYTPPIAMA